MHQSNSIKLENRDIPTSEWISNYLISHFSGLNEIDAWGEKSFFYNPEGLLKRGVYFCTLKEKDGDHDKASELNRANIFRVNFGVSKQTFLNIFHTLPKRPSKGNVIEGPYDFRELDVLTPHPVYGWMAWVSILNPSIQSWDKITELRAESYQITLKKYFNKKLS